MAQKYFFSQNREIFWIYTFWAKKRRNNFFAQKEYFIFFWLKTCRSGILLAWYVRPLSELVRCTPIISAQKDLQSLKRLRRKEVFFETEYQKWETKSLQGKVRQIYFFFYPAQTAYVSYKNVSVLVLETTVCCKLPIQNGTVDHD